MAKAFRLSYLHKDRPSLYERPAPAPWLRNVYAKECAKTISEAYWTKIYWATPPWLNEDQLAEMKRIYLTAPDGHHVDHIVPLKSPLVCGLHVPWNLKAIDGAANMSKSNNWWPDHPYENIDLFGHPLEPEQYELL